MVKWSRIVLHNFSMAGKNLRKISAKLNHEKKKNKKIPLCLQNFT